MNHVMPPPQSITAHSGKPRETVPRFKTGLSIPPQIRDMLCCGSFKTSCLECIVSCFRHLCFTDFYNGSFLTSSIRLKFAEWLWVQQFCKCKLDLNALIHTEGGSIFVVPAFCTGWVVIKPWGHTWCILLLFPHHLKMGGINNFCSTVYIQC